jgi:CrcB protein
MKLGLVALGGALGAISRHLVSTLFLSRFGSRWPWGTFFINMTGCFMIGFFLTLTTERVTLHENWRFLFPIGFVGAYTTYSTFEYETVRLVQTGAWGRAISYVLLSNVVGYGAVVMAFWAARRVG